MRRKCPYWLRSSTAKRDRQTPVRPYLLRLRPKIRDTHSGTRPSSARLQSFVMDLPDSPLPPSDEFENTAGNMTAGLRRRRQGERSKAKWDYHQTRVLLTLTASLIENGHRRGNFLSPAGYNQLITDFNRITGQTLTIAQVKSRIVQLGKDWRAWIDLKNPNSRVTGMGWNSEINTWDAPDWWWAQQQQTNPQVLKFKDRGLDHVDLMEKVFGGTTATGEWHWTPSATPAAPNAGQSSSMPNHEEYVGSGGGPSVAEPNIAADGIAATSSGGVRRPREAHDDTDDGGSGSRRRQSHTARLTDAIVDMANAVRGRSNEVRLVWGTRENSMQDCIGRLLAMESLDPQSELYLFAIDLFSSAVNRDAFMHQPDDDYRMRWLLYQQRKHERMQAPQSYHPQYPNSSTPGPQDTFRGFFPPQ